MPLRRIVFWCHLTAGSLAGLVIFVMCVTGALLAFEPQILAWIEHDARRVEPSPAAVRIGPRSLLDAAVAYMPDGAATAFTVESDLDAAAAVTFGRDTMVYVDPYTVRVVGTGSSRARDVFRWLTEWHRWLGADGLLRGTTRAVTGAANFLFLGLAISGWYLWWPRKWTTARVRAVTLFDTRARGKARDFNWHNVIGFWCAPVLVLLTATGVVMSYRWANYLLYRVAGSSPSTAAGAATGPERAGAGPSANVQSSPTLDTLLTQAERTMPTWKSMSVRLPLPADGPVSITLTDAANWNAFARSQLTLDAKTGRIVRWEPYASTPGGQKARGWVRFGHTGELFGWPSQLIAGVACVGGAVLVWTGLALAIRRFLAWRIVRRWPAAESPNVSQDLARS